MMKKFILIVLCLVATVCYSGDSVLLWMVDANTIVDDTRDLYTFLSEEYPAGNPMTGEWGEYGYYDNEYSVRLAVKDHNGNTLGYLPVAYEIGYDPAAGGPQYEFDPDYVIAGIGHPGQDPNGLYGANWTQSDVSNEMLMEYVFQIELGHEVYNALIDDYDWTTIAISEEAEGTWLKNQLHTYVRQSLDPMDSTPWAPNLYTIPSPEPNTLLLILCGVAALGLKRNCKT